MGDRFFSTRFYCFCISFSLSIRIGLFLLFDGFYRTFRLYRNFGFDLFMLSSDFFFDQGGTLYLRFSLVVTYFMSMSYCNFSYRVIIISQSYNLFFGLIHQFVEFYNFIFLCKDSDSFKNPFKFTRINYYLFGSFNPYLPSFLLLTEE